MEEPNPCGMYECGAPDCGCEDMKAYLQRERDNVSRALYHTERERAKSQGKRVLGDSGAMNKAQLSEAKRQLERVNESKTHRRNRNL